MAASLTGDARLIHSLAAPIAHEPLCAALSTYESGGFQLLGHQPPLRVQFLRSVLALPQASRPKPSLKPHAPRPELVQFTR